MSKLSILFVVVGLMSYISAAPEPNPRWMMDNPALEMLERMHNGQFPMPQMKFPEIHVMSPEEMADDFKKSGNGHGVGSFISSTIYTDENGNVKHAVNGANMYKDGEDVKVYKYGDKN